MTSNTATFTLNIGNIVKKATDKMGVESVSVAVALSHADTLEISCRSPLEYCCQLWNPWKAKHIQGIEAILRTHCYQSYYVASISF